MSSISIFIFIYLASHFLFLFGMSIYLFLSRYSFPFIYFCLFFSIFVRFVILQLSSTILTYSSPYIYIYTNTIFRTTPDFREGIRTHSAVKCEKIVKTQHTIPREFYLSHPHMHIYDKINIYIFIICSIIIKNVIRSPPKIILERK